MLDLVALARYYLFVVVDDYSFDEWSELFLRLVGEVIFVVREIVAKTRTYIWV